MKNTKQVLALAMAVAMAAGLLAAEGQVDEILQLEKLQLVSHRLKLRGLAGVEALSRGKGQTDIFNRRIKYRKTYRKKLRLS